MTHFQQDILTDILKDIFKVEARQFQEEIDEVIHRNREILGPGTEDGFWYGDRWYGGSWKSGLSTQSLHHSLYPQMARLMHHAREVDNDTKIISQVLSKLISSCDTLEGVRNELPECIIELDRTKWSEYPRTRPEAQSIGNNPRDVRQYLTVLDIIRSYCALRLIL